MPERLGSIENNQGIEMNARIKELIRDANTQITPADRNAMLGLIESLEAENKKLAHERAVYLAVLEGQEFKKLDELPNVENAVERAHAIGAEAAKITKEVLGTFEQVVTRFMTASEPVCYGCAAFDSEMSSVNFVQGCEGCKARMIKMNENTTNG